LKLENPVLRTVENKGPFEDQPSASRKTSLKPGGSYHLFSRDLPKNTFGSEMTAAATDFSGLLTLCAGM
jgi:hypothetical protein